MTSSSSPSSPTTEFALAAATPDMLAGSSAPLLFCAEDLLYDELLRRMRGASDPCVYANEFAGIVEATLDKLQTTAAGKLRADEAKALAGADEKRYDADSIRLLNDESIRILFLRKLLSKHRTEVQAYIDKFVTGIKSMQCDLAPVPPASPSASSSLALDVLSAPASPTAQKLIKSSDDEGEEPVKLKEEEEKEKAGPLTLATSSPALSSPPPTIIPPPTLPLDLSLAPPPRDSHSPLSMLERELTNPALSILGPLKWEMTGDLARTAAGAQLSAADMEALVDEARLLPPVWKYTEMTHDTDRGRAVARVWTKETVENNAYVKEQIMKEKDSAGRQYVMWSRSASHKWRT